MTHFINDNGKIDLSLVDARDYEGFKGEFIEDLDPHLARLVLDDQSTFKVPQEEYVEIDGVWETQQKRDENGELLWVKAENSDVDLELPRFTPESKTLLQKRLNMLRNGNQLKILYQQKKGNLGRYYSHEDNSLTCLARNIRNTIYFYQGWIDYDFEASHPTILSQLGVKLRIPTPRLDEWVRDKKPIVKKLSDHHSVQGEPPLQKDHIKKLVCATLYGGGLETWALGSKQPNGTRKGGIIGGKPEKNELPMKCRNYDNYTKGHTWWLELRAEVKKISKKLIDANPQIRERVARVDDPDWKKNNSTISYILGIFENECLYTAYQYGLNNELITARRCNLAYDGFTTPPPPPYTDRDFHLNAVNEFIFEKTGFKMKMIVKEFDSWTIQYDLIDARRQLVIADLVVEDPPVAIAEELSNRDQEYLIWKEKFERLHTKIINNANYMKRIHTQTADGKEHFVGYKIFSENELVGAYKHESYMKLNRETNKSKKTKFITEWIEDATINRKDDAKILPPPLYCPPNTLNLWKPSDYFGRDIEPTDEKYDQWAVDLWLNHIGIMCDHDERAIEYVINWFAHLLQKPAEKSTHLIITGKQGTGKTIALAPIKKIMGGGYFESTSPERDVWGNFNPLMASSLLVVLSECDKRNAYGSENKIKALITDPEMTINDKGVKPFTIISFHRFITPTNHFDPAKLEEEERRNMIIKMSDEKKKDWDYFNSFAATWDDDNACLSLYSYLMKRDISKWNRMDIPHTEYHKELVEFNSSPLDQFLAWLVSPPKDWVCDDNGYFSRFGSEVYDEFRKWREKFGGKYDVNGSSDLMKKIYCSLDLPKDCLEKGTRNKIGARALFHLENLRKHYKVGKYGEEGKCLIDLSNVKGTLQYDQEQEKGSDCDSDSDDEIVKITSKQVWDDKLGCYIEDENEDTAEVLDGTNSIKITVADGKSIRVKKNRNE